MSEIEEVQCRTCLAQGSEMLSLNADHVVCLKVMPVLTLLKTCTSAQIEINDAYPQHVCLECIRKVESAFEFRQQCEKIDKTLRSGYKTEVLDEDSDIYEEYEALDDEEYANQSEIIPSHEEGEIKCEEIEILEAYTCTICDLIFPTEDQLLTHESTAHPPTFYQCPKCPVRFISQALLDRHVAKHSSTPEKKKPRKKTKTIDYACTKCGKKCNSMAGLRLHVRKHAQPQQSKEPQPSKEPQQLKKENVTVDNTPVVQSYICEECGEQFNSEKEIKLHIERIHSSKITHCKICYKVFPTIEALQDHETSHDNTKKEEASGAYLHKMVYKCKTCAHEVNVLTEIKDHLTQTHQIDKQYIFKNLLYTCSECQMDFPSIYEYFNHTLQRNGTFVSTNINVAKRKKAYICSVADCGKAFPSPSALKNHSRSHETHWPKKCKYCDTIVSKLPEYIRHLNDLHEGLKKFNCKTCDKKFFSERNLKTHSGIHSGERNYMCDYCGFSFHAHNNLVSHRRIHEGIKPYKCTYCPTAFSQYAGLRSHLLNHTQEKKYECPICSRKFLRHSAMKNHIKTHTGQKDYMCHVCGARFGASSSRKKHLLTHTGERNHVCDVCGKAFGRKSNLTVHRKIHTGETPHVCDICGKGFIQKHVLRSHMDTHKKHGTQIITNKRNAGKRKQISIQKFDDEQEQLDVIDEELTE